MAVQKVYAFLNFKSSNFFFQIKYPHIKFVSLTQVRKNTVHPPYIYIFWVIQLLFIETKHKLQRKTQNKQAKGNLPTTATKTKLTIKPKQAKTNGKAKHTNYCPNNLNKNIYKASQPVPLAQ